MKKTCPIVVSLFFALVLLQFVPITVGAQTKDSSPAPQIRQNPRTHFYSVKDRSIIADTLTKNGRQLIVYKPGPTLISAVQNKNPVSTLKASNHANARNTKTLGALSISFTPKGTTCGMSNGSILVSASGGTPPYTYSENGYPFQSGALFTNLTPGTYNVTVMDALGILATGSVTLNNTYDMPTGVIEGYTVPTSCTGTNGTVTLLASGGTPPYTYTDNWASFQSSPVFTNLSSSYSSYSFFVIDANGCFSPIPFFAYGSYCPLYSQVGYLGYTCNNDAWIMVNYSQGGTPPYEYSIDGIHYQSSGNFYNLSPGIQLLYTKDATGEVAIVGCQILEGCPLKISVLETDATCGLNNGSIVVTASEGTAP